MNNQEPATIHSKEKIMAMYEVKNYRGPFTVHRFVDKLEVWDANGSECKNIGWIVEFALNQFREEAEKSITA